MTRDNIMDAMNGIGEHLIVEAAEKLGFLNGSAAIVKAERRKGQGALSRFMNSGWGVAAVCALVAVSVMGGIIWAGNQPGVKPPVVTPEETTAPTEVDTMDYTGEDQTDISVKHGDRAIYPRWFFVWSGPGDGFGFKETVRQEEGGAPVLPRVYYAKDGSISPCELILPKNGSLRGVSFYDDDMNETAIAYDGEFHYESFLKDLPVGRHHICLYIEYTEDGKAVAGSDYAFTMVVVNTADEVTDAEETETEADTGLESTPYIGTDVLEGNDFEPGVILLGLKEPYTGNLNELFPELGISEVEDINLTWYEQIKDSHGKEAIIESYKNKIGTEFIVILTDNTKEAVLAGIAAIQSNPLVAYASPNHVVYPTT